MHLLLEKRLYLLLIWKAGAFLLARRSGTLRQTSKNITRYGGRGWTKLNYKNVSGSSVVNLFLSATGTAAGALKGVTPKLYSTGATVTGTVGAQNYQKMVKRK